MPFQERARLDGQIIVKDITDHMRSTRKFYRAGFDMAVDRPVNDNGIRYDFALDMGRFTDEQCR